ncbi:hypothetical protein FOZ62_010879, partial [Perkinsus olseni]
QTVPPDPPVVHVDNTASRSLDAWDYRRCDKWVLGFGREAELTYEQFYAEFPRKVGAFFIFMGRTSSHSFFRRRIDAQHGPLTKSQRKFLRWAQYRVIRSSNPESELDRLGVREKSVRQSLLEDLEQYLEPQAAADGSSAANDIEETRKRRESVAANETSRLREERGCEALDASRGVQNQIQQANRPPTSASKCARGKTALSRALWAALDDPSLPGFPLRGERWASTSGAQEAWMRAVIEDLPSDHPGGWFYPPDPSLDITPNVRKYQLWPFYFWRPQNSVWARLRSPEDPSCALPCINDSTHTVRRAGLPPLGPRKVVSRNGIFYIMAERFRCCQCKAGHGDADD